METNQTAADAYERRIGSQTYRSTIEAD